MTDLFDRKIASSNTLWDSYSGRRTLLIFPDILGEGSTGEYQQLSSSYILSPRNDVRKTPSTDILSYYLTWIQLTLKRRNYDKSISIKICASHCWFSYRVANNNEENFHFVLFETVWLNENLMNFPNKFFFRKFVLPQLRPKCPIVVVRLTLYSTRENHRSTQAASI